MNLNILDIWNERKKELNQLKNCRNFKEREVFFLCLGQNIGYEQNGKGKAFLRPVIILKKFNQDSFIGIPLTKTQKKGQYYFHFYFKEGINSVAILSQIRLFDAKRLMNKIEMISEKDFTNLQKKTSNLLFTSLSQ